MKGEGTHWRRRVSGVVSSNGTRRFNNTGDCRPAERHCSPYNTHVPARRAGSKIGTIRKGNQHRGGSVGMKTTRQRGLFQPYQPFQGGLGKGVGNRPPFALSPYARWKGWNVGGDNK